jgi:RNA polymerase sigma-70 factor (ECF subfamily)
MNRQLPPDSVSDDVLLARLATGDEVAFTALFRRHQHDVYRVALLMTGSPASAEDVTQDVFLAVMSDAGRYESGRSSVKAWLCGIARNHARRRLERDGRNVSLIEDPDGPAGAGAVQPDPVGELTNRERVDALRRAILNLPLRYREVVVLCDLEEISYADAAVALDCAVGTVRSRLHRARALLAAKVRAGLPSQGPEGQRMSRCLA